MFNRQLFENSVLTLLGLALGSAINAAPPEAARKPSLVSGEVTETGLEQAIDAGSLKVASAAVATPDGGFLIAGGYRTDQYNRNVIRQFYMKISGVPSISWERDNAFDWRNPAPVAVYLLAGGGYWTLGIRFAKDGEAEQKKARLSGLAAANPYQAIMENEYDAVAPINSSGASLPVITASTLGTSQNVSCGTELKDGFALVGFNTSPKGGSWLGAIPLIEKIDRSGHLLWIHEFPQDQGQAIDVTDQIQQKPCKSPITSADGAITTSINVRVRAVTHSGDEWVKAASHPGVLVVKLDENGNEIARLRHDNVSDGFLLPTNAGLDLLERNVPVYPAAGSVPLAQALVEINRFSALGSIARVTQLDGSLRPTVNTEYKTGALETIKAAYRTPDGGMLLAGCPVNGGNNYVVHISPSGTVSPPLQISPNQGMQQCSSFVFSSGAHPGEALVFVWNDIVGGRVITLRYANH
jgi:hypothetical protein